MRLDEQIPRLALYTALTATPSSLQPGSLDILVLPELAFAGYCFTSSADIAPWLELPTEGPTWTWARQTALHLECYVCVGFAEKTSDAGVAYNSLMVVSPSGTLSAVYRKHFLYETDETWAQEGPSFETIEITVRGRTLRIATAICMDLNPHRFTAPFYAFEFATHAVESKTDVVLCSTAWLDSKTTTAEEEVAAGTSQWELASPTISYWALRCSPLLDSPRAIPFIACNRVGSEGDVTFVGCSCVMMLGEKPTVYAYAPKRGQHLIQATIPIPDPAI